jgi:O-succinylhomoserine sulfhydrylase
MRGIVCFELKGGLDSGRKFSKSIAVTHFNSKSRRYLIDRIASGQHHHAKLTEEERLAVSITPGLIRISVGLEHPQDVLNDILQSLEALIANPNSTIPIFGRSILTYN